MRARVNVGPMWARKLADCGECGLPIHTARDAAGWIESRAFRWVHVDCTAAAVALTVETEVFGLGYPVPRYGEHVARRARRYLAQ